MQTSSDAASSTVNWFHQLHTDSTRGPMHLQFENATTLLQNTILESYLLKPHKLLGAAIKQNTVLSHCCTNFARGQQIKLPPCKMPDKQCTG
jgi:hypothetical protein